MLYTFAELWLQRVVDIESQFGVGKRFDGFCLISRHKIHFKHYIFFRSSIQCVVLLHNQKIDERKNEETVLCILLLSDNVDFSLPLCRTRVLINMSYNIKCLIHL